MKILNLTLAAGLGVIALTGCQQQENTAEPPPIATSSNPAMSPTSSAPVMGTASSGTSAPGEAAPPGPAKSGEGAPAAGGNTEGDKKIEALTAKLEKNPSDAKLKKELAQAHYEVGYAMEYNPDLPPRVKYRGALKHFRETLKLDPSHEKAAKEKKQIEDVYKSMGMPVPE